MLPLQLCQQVAYQPITCAEPKVDNTLPGLTQVFMGLVAPRLNVASLVLGYLTGCANAFALSGLVKRCTSALYKACGCVLAIVCCCMCI